MGQRNRGELLDTEPTILVIGFEQIPFRYDPGMNRPLCPTCGRNTSVRVRHNPWNYLLIAINLFTWVEVFVELCDIQWRCKKDNTRFTASAN